MYMYDTYISIYTSKYICTEYYMYMVICTYIRLMAVLQYMALIMQRGFRARDKSGAVWLGCNHQRA